VIVGSPNFILIPSSTFYYMAGLHHFEEAPGISSSNAVFRVSCFFGSLFCWILESSLVSLVAIMPHSFWKIYFVLLFNQAGGRCGRMNLSGIFLFPDWAEMFHFVFLDQPQIKRGSWIYLLVFV